MSVPIGPGLIPFVVIQADVLSRLYGHHVDVVHVHGRVLVVADAAPGGDGADLTASHGAEAG